MQAPLCLAIGGHANRPGSDHPVRFVDRPITMTCGIRRSVSMMRCLVLYGSPTWIIWSRGARTPCDLKPAASAGGVLMQGENEIQHRPQRQVGVVTPRRRAGRRHPSTHSVARTPCADGSSASFVADSRRVLASGWVSGRATTRESAITTCAETSVYDVPSAQCDVRVLVLEFFIAGYAKDLAGQLELDARQLRAYPPGQSWRTIPLRHQRRARPESNRVRSARRRADGPVDDGGNGRTAGRPGDPRLAGQATRTGRGASSASSTRSMANRGPNTPRCTPCSHRRRSATSTKRRPRRRRHPSPHRRSESVATSPRPGTSRHCWVPRRSRSGRST